MALINRNSNDYQPGAEWAGGIRSLGAMLTQIPAIRAMAAQRGAMAQFQMAHAGYENAAAGEANARTGLINSQKNNEDNTAQGHLQFAGALKRLATDPNDPEALGDAFEGMGKGFKTDPANTMKAVGLLLSQSMARTGSTNVNQMAELQAGAPALAVADANNTARAQLPVNNQVVIPTGGTLASRLTGQPIAEGGVTLRPGEQRFAPKDLATALASPSAADVDDPNSQPDATPATPEASVAGTPKSSMVQGIIAQGIASIIKDNKNFPDAGTKNSAIAAIKSQLGNLGDSPAPVSATSPVTTPLASPAAQGVRVRNKRTGQMGTQMPDGSIIPDSQ